MARIMLVGAGRKQVVGLRSILRQDGHHVASTRTVASWRDAERQFRPELILATVDAPEDVLGAPGGVARGFPAPLLFVQNEEDLLHDLFLDERLIDRVQSPFMAEELLARVDALVRALRVVRRVRRTVHDEPPAATRIGRAMQSVGSRLAGLLGTRLPRYEKPLAPYLEVAARLAEWADQRDAFEPGHAERVASFCAMIAEAMSLTNAESSSLLRAAMLHDIGKASVPADLLRQRGPLRDEQRRLLRTHPERGAALLRALDKDEQVAEAILYHHEQPDGEGYYRKERDAIPRCASILGVAEAYDAMTSTRIHEPLSRAEALARLRAQRASKYDADAVDALVDVMTPKRSTILTIPLAPRR